MIAAGTLRHRVTLQQPASGQDAAGQPATGWVDVATVWADVRHASGLETIKADAQTAMRKASIRIRYRAGMDPAMRVVHDGDVYEIKAVLPDRTGRAHIDLACEAIDA